MKSNVTKFKSITEDTVLGTFRPFVKAQFTHNIFAHNIEIKKIK